VENIVHNIVLVIQVICALGVILMMAVQTDKAEQGGVMGLGASGGRNTGEIDLAVGPERILKPLTKWLCGGFLASSILAAMDPARINIWYLLGGSVLFVVAMMFGGLVWQTATGMRRS
jgi:preprotein translocase subunit SecG